MNPESNSQDASLPYVFGNYPSRITPASQILSSAGIRPLYTQTGKIINPEMINTISPMAPFGGGPSGLKLEPNYAYRTVGLDEIKSIYDEGVMITDPSLEGQKMRARAQTTKKMFSESNPSSPNAGYSEKNLVLRVKKDNVPTGVKGKPVSASDIEVFSSEGGKWKSQSVPEFLGKEPKQTGAVKGKVNASEVAGRSMSAVGKGLMVAGAIAELTNVPERIKGYYINALVADPTWRPDASDKFGMSLFAGLESAANFATSGIYDIATKEEAAKTKGGYSGTGPLSERRSMPKISGGEGSVHAVPEKKLPEIRDKVLPENIEKYLKKKD